MLVSRSLALESRPKVRLNPVPHQSVIRCQSARYHPTNALVFVDFSQESQGDGRPLAVPLAAVGGCREREYPANPGPRPSVRLIAHAVILAMINGRLARVPAAIQSRPNSGFSLTLGRTLASRNREFGVPIRHSSPIPTPESRSNGRSARVPSHSSCPVPVMTSECAIKIHCPRTGIASEVGFPTA